MLSLLPSGRRLRLPPLPPILPRCRPSLLLFPLLLRRQRPRRQASYCRALHWPKASRPVGVLNGSAYSEAAFPCYCGRVEWALRLRPSRRPAV